MIKWPEPVAYQYRWTNPNGETQPSSRLEWKDVSPAWNQTVAQKCDELLAYRYKGEPVYEVRALVPEAQLKQAVRDALTVAFANCKALDNDENSADYRQGAIWCGERIRALIKEIQ